jgi:probable HAF family extracellular repeat protein
MKTRLLLGLLLATMLFLLTGGAYAAGYGPASYRVVNLGDPAGGQVSQGTTNNQPGRVAGWSLQADSTMQAELWAHGSAVSLGTLGSPTLNSSVAWPNRNDQGVIVGISETNELQPLGESWSCFLAVFFVADGHVCRGFVWRDGQMSPLPTLGGDNGFATGVNNRGEIVGWAENRIHDPTCDEFTNTGQVLQFEAVMWVPGGDDGGTGAGSGYRAIELPPYPGDLDGAATAINQWGEAVGISGICDAAIGGGTAEHMVMWSHGQVVRELPTLGGAYWNTPMDINDRGNVAGFSDLPGDGPTIAQANFQAFFWSRRPYLCNGATVPGGSTCNLGALGPNLISEALGVNDQDQVVGLSQIAVGSSLQNHAFIWQHGRMIDLNDLVVPGTTLTLTIAQDINDRGEITGQATTPSGATVAFEAIPVN